MNTPAIAIIGDGKMGRSVVDVARAEGLSISAIIGAHTPVTAESLAGAQVAIEFTEPGAAVMNVKACVQADCPIVVGTTGWYADLDAVTNFVRDHDGTMLWSANFSLGVYVFAELVRHAGELLSQIPAFDAHLVETHHQAKKDAPSGTALMLQRTMASVYNRDVPITSVRVGAVPGTHELILDAKYEQMTLTHTARDRRVFAEGAVAASRWLIGRRGIFTMADMFGSKRS